jgi:hypothetical protein
MKARCVLYLIVILGVVSITHGQLVRSYGIKLGAVSASQTWHYTYTSDLTTGYRWGVTGGVYVELLDIPLLSFIAEIQYTQKGMTVTVPVTTESQPNGTGPFTTMSSRVDYLSVPLLAKLRLKSPLFTPYLIAGPRVDLLVSKRGDGFEAVVDKFESTDFGGTVGLGVELHTLFPVGLLAEFRYNSSFKDVFNNNLLTVRNHSFDFLLGMRL